MTTQPGPADAYDYGYNDAPKQITGESKLPTFCSQEVIDFLLPVGLQTLENATTLTITQNWPKCLESESHNFFSLCRIHLLFSFCSAWMLGI